MTAGSNRYSFSWGLGLLCCALPCCGKGPSVTLPTAAAEALPESLVGCPEADGDWEEVSVFPPQRFVRDPVYLEVVYGLHARGMIRESSGSDFCTVLSWDEDEGFVQSSSTLLAPTECPNLRFLAPTVWWGSVYVSKDEGASWSLLEVSTPDAQQVNLKFLEIDASTDTLYALGEELGIISSEDYGKTWQLLEPDPEDARFESLHVDPSGSGRIFASAAGLSHSIWSSDDRGASWAKAESPLRDGGSPSLSVAWTDPVTLYASTFTVIFRS